MFVSVNCALSDSRPYRASLPSLRPTTLLPSGGVCPRQTIALLCLREEGSLLSESCERRVRGAWSRVRDFVALGGLESGIEARRDGSLL